MSDNPSRDNDRSQQTPQSFDQNQQPTDSQSQAQSPTSAGERHRQRRRRLMEPSNTPPLQPDAPPPPRVTDTVARAGREFVASLGSAFQAIMDPSKRPKPDLSNLPPRQPFQEDGKINYNEVYPDTPGQARPNPFPLGAVVPLFALTGFVQGAVINRKRQIVAYQVRARNTANVTLSQHGLPIYREPFKLSISQSLKAASIQSIKFGSAAAVFWGLDSLVFRGWGFSPWNKAIAGALTGGFIGASAGGGLRGIAGGAVFFGIMGLSLGFTEKGLFYAEGVIVDNQLKRIEYIKKQEAESAADAAAAAAAEEKARRFRPTTTVGFGPSSLPDRKGSDAPSIFDDPWPSEDDKTK